MSNFQSKTKELVNTATAASVLYKDTPERQFKEMGEAAKRLYPGEDGQSKTDKYLQQADVVGRIYGVQWTRNKVAQERIPKLLKNADSKITDKANPKLDNESEQYRNLVNAVSQRNRIASQFGLAPIGLETYMEGYRKNEAEAMYVKNEAEAMREPYHIQTKTDDKGHMVEKTVSKSKQLDWNMDMILHGQDRYKGKQADAMRTVLQRRFAKIPNPMTVAEFKGGPEW